MIAQSRQCRLDKRVSGGRGKLHRCTGAIVNGKATFDCPVLARGCKQTDGTWKVTEVVLNHVARAPARPVTKSSGSIADVWRGRQRRS
ncbi:unnamed protein product [Ectocarpus sp. 12 AP-2014]